MAGTIWGIDRRNYYTKIVAGYLGGFAALGREVKTVTQEALAAALAARLEGRGEEAPAFVLDLNFSGVTARALGELGIPYVAPVWDSWIASTRTPPRLEQYRPFGKDFVFTYSEAQVEAFRRLGVAHVEYLPTCCDLEVFQPIALTPEETARYASPVSIYASPLVADQADGNSYYAVLQAAIHAVRSGPSERRLEAARSLRLLEDAMREQDRDLYRYRLPDILAETARASGSPFMTAEDTPEKETLTNQIARHVSMLQRTEAARLLAPLGVAVWGPSDWQAILREGIRYAGPADYHRDLPRLVAGSAINLNVSQCHTLDAVPPRVFEVLACGGFLMTSPLRHLDRHFTDGEDLVVFSSREELVAKARHYLDRPEERRRIAESGMRKARARDGFVHRCRRILEVVEA